MDRLAFFLLSMGGLLYVSHSFWKGDVTGYIVGFTIFLGAPVLGVIHHFWKKRVAKRDAERLRLYREQLARELGRK